MPHWKEVIRRDTEQSPVVYFPKQDGSLYPYAILPLERYIEPEYMQAVVEGSLEMLKPWLPHTDAFALIEAKGLTLSPVPMAGGKPTVIFRKRVYPTTPQTLDQIVVEQTTAYRSEITKMCGVGIIRGWKYIIFDDMISGGGTAISTTNAMEKNNCKVIGIASVYERGDGVRNIENETRHEVKALARIEIRGDRVFVERFYDK